MEGRRADNDELMAIGRKRDKAFGHVDNHAPERGDSTKACKHRSAIDALWPARNNEGVPLRQAFFATYRTRWKSEMNGQDLVDDAQRIGQVAATLRSKASDRRDVDTATLAELSQILPAIVSDIAWILGRNFGSSTVDFEVSLAARLVPRPRVILDIGANAGHWSLAALNTFPQARVMAFEPQAIHQANLERLRHQFAQRFGYRTLALSDKRGAAQLYANEEGSGLASLYPRDLRRFYNVSMEPTERVTTSTILDQIEDLSLDEISILKIDVEGHELSVLAGAGSAIQKVRYIQFEFGGAMIDAKVSFRDFMTFFAELPFKIFRISPLGLMPIHHYTEALEGFEMSNYVAVHTSVL